MRIGAILKRWFDTLATLLLGWHERQRERRALTVAFGGQQLGVRELRLAGAAAQQNGRAGQTISDELVRMARDSLVILDFSADQIVTRHISVPAQAHKFLAGVVRNQVERLSPWLLNDVVYGFDTGA